MRISVDLQSKIEEQKDLQEALTVINLADLGDVTVI